MEIKDKLVEAIVKVFKRRKDRTSQSPTSVVSTAI